MKKSSSSCNYILHVEQAVKSRKVKNIWLLARTFMSIIIRNHPLNIMRWLNTVDVIKFIKKKKSTKGLITPSYTYFLVLTSPYSENDFLFLTHIYEGEFSWLLRWHKHFLYKKKALSTMTDIQSSYFTSFDLFFTAILHVYMHCFHQRKHLVQGCCFGFVNCLSRAREIGEGVV